MSAALSVNIDSEALATALASLSDDALAPLASRLGELTASRVNPADRVLTVAEAADAIRALRSFIYNCRADGRLTPHERGSRALAERGKLQRLISRRAQPVIATSSVSFSDGFMNPSVSRGRLLRLRANAARSSALCTERSVPFGMY